MAEANFYSCFKHFQVKLIGDKRTPVTIAEITEGSDLGKVGRKEWKGPDKRLLRLVGARAPNRADEERRPVDGSPGLRVRSS